MEPDSLSRPGEASRTPPAEWRTLARLRERVEAAVREIERLRADNAALAARVGELQGALGDGGPAPALPGDPDTLRTRVQGFIDAIDAVLAADESPADAATTGAATSGAPAAGAPAADAP